MRGDLATRYVAQCVSQSFSQYLHPSLGDVVGGVTGRAGDTLFRARVDDRTGRPLVDYRFETEYSQYGWEFPTRPAVRIRQMEEAVRLILAMWAEKRTTFHGRYFHVEDAILEPKPVQKPRPPVLIAGGGEQLTLRAVARLADACNIGGDPDMVRHKLSVLRGHCDGARRDNATIETTHNNSWLLARDEAAVAAKRERLTARGPLRGFVGTVSEAIDLIGQYQDVGVQLLINSDYRNDNETHELFASEIMPHFAGGP